MLVALPGLEHRQLRPAGGARVRLAEIRCALRPGDALLLGADLVKPERDLLLAYDDPLGVTAAFNKNLLVRMNTELLADFDLDGVRPPRRLERGRTARRDAPRSREAAGGHASRARRRTFGFGAGSHLDGELLQVRVRRRSSGWRESAGFRSREQWIEPDARFALTLFQAT